MNGRIDEFESLRGMMALWVVIGHVFYCFSPPPIMQGGLWNFFCNNGKPVDIFIALSGFVIFFLFGKSPESYPRYIARRFLRLFPIYMICVLLAVVQTPMTDAVLHSLVPPTARTLARIAILNQGIENFWPHFLAHATMLHGIVPGTLLPQSEYTFVGQAWSISVEWQFYIVAPLFFWLATWRRRYIGLPVILFLCAFLFHARLFSLGEGFIGGHVAYFGLGCASCFLWRANPRILGVLARYTILLIPLLCVAWSLLFPREWQVLIWVVVLLSCNSVRFIDAGVLERGLATLLRTPILRWLGRISYPVYAVHMVALYAVLRVLRDSGFGLETMIVLTTLGTVGATLLLADVLHRWVEKPCIDFGRHLPIR